MNIGINVLHFLKAGIWEEDRSFFEAVDLVKDAGFKHLDMDFNYIDKDFVPKAIEYINKNGLIIHQSHMPFNRYDKIDFDVFEKRVLESAENAKLAGSKILVVHGDEFDFKNMRYSFDAALEFNYKLFYSIVDFAVKNNMRVAFESVFDERDFSKGPRFGSFVEELCALVDKYNTDAVGICWDTGHSHLHYAGGSEAALKAAGSRVIATHIHDNFYNGDLHLPPFIGHINWKELMGAFKAIDYKGDFTFEMGYNRIPKAMAPDFVKLLYKSAEYLINEF